MKDYHNLHERLREYYKLLSNNIETGFIVDDDYYIGMPFSKISKCTQVPIEVVRQDIVNILSWKEDLLYFDDDIADEDLSDQLFDALENLDLEDFHKLLLEGVFDEVPVYTLQNDYAFHHIELNPEEAYAFHHIELNPEEAYAFNHYQLKMSNQKTSDADVTYRIKDSYRYSYVDNLTQKLEQVNTAIQNDSSIRIDYSPAHDPDLSITIKPLKIAYDSIDNVYAIITIIDDEFRVYRLDRINAIYERKQKSNINNSNLLSIAPNVWGNNFTEKPYKVKVRFYNEANVWNKVRKDLSYRTNGKLYEQDGYLYYEDIVYGIYAFRTWIYSYGSSAIVLEPKELRASIIESLKERTL